MAHQKYAIIGTAGHVDHGKTTLIKALTGIDTDRLTEEKKRGITIENGFAHLELPGGERAGIVDVPGHERFIKNMLAGSGGIDIALLVVAADEGVMPQTKEHLDILRLLDIRSGVVALTKADLVDDEWLALIKEDLKHSLSETSLADSRIIEISAHTGRGMETLRNELLALIKKRVERTATKEFRVPIDRVFSLTGFGTVVTGTLMEGALDPEMPAMVYPAEAMVKIRSVQVHSEAVPAGHPGQRVAVNLSNVKKEELARGDILATPGSLRPTMMLDVRLEVLANTPKSLKSGALANLYLGAKELLCKIVLLDQAELAGEQAGYAQLRLMEPTAAKKGDRFVVRFLSPAVTAGGGEVLDAAPLKRRRYKPDILRQMEIKKSGAHIDRVELAVKERPGQFSTMDELTVRANLDKSRVKNDFNILASKGILRPLTKEVFIHRDEMSRLKGTLNALLKKGHKDKPHSPGLPLEELRGRLMLGASPAVWEAFICFLVQDKFIKKELDKVRLFGFEPVINEEENELISKLEAVYLSFGLMPLATSVVEPATDQAGERRRRAAFAVLTRRGILIRIDALTYMHKEHYERAWQVFKTLAQGGAVVKTGQFRDALETSRRLSIAILEFFDQGGLTKVLEEGRALR